MKIENGVLVKVDPGEIENGIFNVPEGVTSIDKYVFSDCSGLTEINIPEGVTSIGYCAFADCSGLTEINIPEGVISIGPDAFAGCRGLTEISLPESLTEISSGAFSGCSGLTEINIPEGVTSIGNLVFAYCSKLTEINIPEGVTSIGDNTFTDCSGLTEISLPDGLTNIYREAFRGCRGLTEISLPEGLTKIGSEAFRGCRGLTEISLPDGLTSIDMGAFSGCSGLTGISLPEGLTRIGDGAFSGCSGLTEINIPEGVTIIGNYVFHGCSKLTKISLPETIVQYENALFKLYKDYGDKIDERLMFGDDIARFNEIKSQAHFSLSRDYDDDFMNELYHKIIFSVGIDELKRMVQIPKLDKKQMKTYASYILLDDNEQTTNIDDLTADEFAKMFRRKEKSFDELYDFKQTLSGDFGVTFKILKQIANISSKSKGENRKSAQLNILKELNSLLDNQDVTSIKDIFERATTNAGLSLSELGVDIQEIQRGLNKSQFQKNMDSVRAELLEALGSSNTTFGEQLAQMQIGPIENIVEDKLRKIFIENSRIEVSDLKQQLIEELTNDGHAIYIRRNAENITNRFINLLQTNKDFKERINHNALDAIRSVRNQVGGRWIKKIKDAFKDACNGQNIESIPDNFTEEQINSLKESLGIGIETDPTAELKKGADRDAAYKLFEKIQSEMPDEEQFIVTYKQLHDMFGGIHYPYSENFREYFKVHRDEFMKKPKYIAEFATICNNFESIINSPELKNAYLNGHLELDDIIGYLGNLKFKNQREGDERLAKLSTSVGKIATEKQFKEVQDVFDIVRKRERSSIPPLYVQDKGSKFRGRMLSPNDILTMFAGNITDCCQKFGDAGMGAMLLGAIEENAGIFVVQEQAEDGNYQIIGQSLTIRQKGTEGNNDRLTFDNIEITENVKNRLTPNEEQEILKIYRDAGKQAMQLDKKFLMQLLKQGKITQEIFDRLVLKEVIAGRGYNDLSLLNSLPEAVTVVPDEAYYKYRSEEWGTKMPWIDSTSSGAPVGSNSYIPVIIAVMDEEERNLIDSRAVQSNKGKTAPKLSDVPLWYGKVDEPQEHEQSKIGSKQVKILKNIEQKVYRPAQQLMNKSDVQDGTDIADCYGIDDLKVVIGSEENWYLIYGTDGKGNCCIQDLALEGGLNSDKNKDNNESQGFSRIATVEMADAIYGLMINSSKDGRKITCNATKDTSLINIKNMIKKGLAEVFDFSGRKIVLSNDGRLVYENGEEVTYRAYNDHDYEDETEIQMLDVEIRANIERMIAEKIKTEKYLERARQLKRMIGTKKEEELDDTRRAIRDDL